MTARRVLRLITRLNIGGPAHQALTLTRDLAPEYATVLAAGEAPEAEGELEDPRVPVVRIPLVRPIRMSKDIEAVWAVRRLIARERPHIVHTHMAKAGAVGRIAAKLSPIKPITIHTFHGHVLEGYFAAPIERGFVGVERALARKTDALVAVSNEVRDDLARLGIGRPEQWHVIPLGFDLKPFLDVSCGPGGLRVHLGLAPEVPLVGILGRLAPVKDHDLLLDALQRLPGVHLAILGDGERRSHLEQRADSRALRGRVHLPGWWRDVPGAMRDLDVVVTASLNEGTPVSLIEALASGKPVVATDVGGVRSVVDHGETGLLVNDRDAASLAGAISTLLEDTTLRRRFGAEGRDRMVRRFSKERLLADIRSLYEQVSS